MEKLEKATQHLGEAEIKEALEEIEAGKNLLLARQKLILLADREENGWNFVKEYKKDDLASGTDDEKQIVKARAASEKAILKRKRNRTQNYPNSTKKDSFKRTYQSSFDPKPSTSKSDFRTNRFDRQCYKCGKRGHLMYNCYSR